VRRIRTLICDDEPDAREGLEDMLDAHPEFEVVGEARDGREAAALIDALRPDLVLLDIQMPELDGFGALAAATLSPLPVVVFVTAYDRHAIRAFEVHALDYLLKPFSDERFAEAMRAARAQVHQRWAGELGQQLAALLGASAATGAASVPASSPARAPAPESQAVAEPPVADEETSPAGWAERIMVRTARRTYFVRVDDIDWIGADDYYARLHVAGKSHLLRESLQSLESRLDPRRFVRVHRSAIANLDRVQHVQSYVRGAYLVSLADGTQLRLSRSRRAAFERALGGRL